MLQNEGTTFHILYVWESRQREEKGEVQETTGQVEMVVKTTTMFRQERCGTWGVKWYPVNGKLYECKYTVPQGCRSKAKNVEQSSNYILWF